MKTNSFNILLVLYIKSQLNVFSGHSKTEKRVKICLLYVFLYICKISRWLEEWVFF